MDKPNLVELMIAEKIGNVLRSVTEQGFDVYDVCAKWLSSTTFSSIMDDDFSIYSRTPKTIQDLLVNEFSSFAFGDQYDKDAAFWFGYLVTYWCYMYHTTGSEILQKYDVVKIVDDYELLHTLSVKIAIERITEDDKL